MGLTLPAIPVQSLNLPDFRGPWSRPDATNVPANQALLSLNAEYNPLQVQSRFGFAPYWSIGKVITTIFNWIKNPDLVSTAGNYLIFYNQTDGKVQWAVNLASPAANDLFSVAGAEGISVSSHGDQVIIASFQTAGTEAPSAIGASQAHIIGVAGAGVFKDVAFMGPLTTKPTLANGSAGTVTAGVHSVGYVLTSENGFTGKVCPVVASDGLFDITSNINASGAHQINISLTGSWPTGCAGLQFVMSTADNPYQYLIIPDSGMFGSNNNFAAPGGSTTTITAVIDISDPLLLATGIDVTNNQFFLTQSTGGDGPFLPFKVLEYGQRTVYLAYEGGTIANPSGNGIPVAYVSEPANPQQLTAQFHALHLPGFKQIMNAFVLRGVLDIEGPDWTYSFEDNQGLPSTWAAPVLVDGTIGSNSALGTVTSASADWAVTATDTGVYVFNGAYQDRPITYMTDSDWRKVNLNAAQTIRIVDNKDKKQLLVAVPMNTRDSSNNLVVATIPNFIMCFDYSDGQTSGASGSVMPDWKSVKYALWPIKGGAYKPRALCVWQNPNTARMETILGPGIADSGKILRQMNLEDDTNGTPAGAFTAYNDDAGPIPFIWETAPLPPGSIGTVFAHNSGYTRCAGNGVLVGQVFGLDHGKAFRWSKTINLQPAPAQEYFNQFYLTSERASVQFSCGINAGDYVILSGYRHCYYPWAVRR